MESRTTVPVVSGSRGKGDVAEVVIACASGLLLAYTVLFLCIMPLVGKIASGREFTIYWATGQQLVHHANPYDTEVMSRIEQAAGLPSTLKVGLMRNPPWGLILALPLGLVASGPGRFYGRWCCWPAWRAQCRCSGRCMDAQKIICIGWGWRFCRPCSV